jgi:hypothetical protein
MPRARKPRPEPAPDDSGSTPEPAAGSGEAEARPSQLEQIRAAITTPAGKPTDDWPELPAPTEEEALELPAAEAEEAQEPAAPEAEAGTEPAEAAPPATQAPERVTSPWVPPPTTPPPGMVPAPAARRGGTASASLAVGIVLVVVGVFFLTMRLFDVDLSRYGWPLYVIIPGLTLLVVGFISLGSGALVPGGIVTVTGLILAYQSTTEDWASWSYAWALVVPGGVGLGIFLQGLRVRSSSLVRQGRSLMFWALMIFLIGFVFFESILNISGHDYGKVGQAALPVLLIIIGVTLLIRNFQRGRSA